MHLLDLPWLPRPSPDERARLTARDLSWIELRRLAGLGWDEPGLTRLAARIARARESGDGGFPSARVLLIAGRTISPLVAPLQASALRHGLLLDATAIEHEEPIAALARLSAGARFDAVLLWPDVEMLGLAASLGDADAETRAISGALDRLKAVLDAAAPLSDIVAPATLAPALDAPRTSLDLRLPGAPRRLIERFNPRLVDEAAGGRMVWDAAALGMEIGLDAWHPGRGALLARHVIGARAVPYVADRLAGFLAAALGRARKILVLDLDGTLWGGILGEDGIEGLALSSGTARGEAHRAIQAFAKRWAARGILLAVLSNNDETPVREVFAQHPDMILREADIAVFEVGWRPKPARLEALANRLKLGLDAFVVLDDDPAQRAELRTAFPEVFVPEPPAEIADWPALLEAAAPFEQATFSASDAHRAADYRADEARAALAAASLKDRDAFLKSLDMRLSVGPFYKAVLPRLAQLALRTNQFNLTTCRRDEVAFSSLMADPSVATFQGALSDRFGLSGIVTLIVCRKGLEAWDIDTWLMSCRVIGRRVEEAMLGVIVEAARAAGARLLRGRYIRSPRNGLVADLYPQLGFAPAGANAEGDTEWVLYLTTWRARDVPIQVIYV